MKVRKPKSQITIDKILTSALEEFSEKGFFGARIDSIAANAGVNKRMIYEHFENKENLYKEVLTSVYEKCAESEREFFSEDLRPQDAIRNVVRIYFKFLYDNPDFVRILMWENLNNADSIPVQQLKSIKAPAFEYIKYQVNRGKEQGIFKADVDNGQIVVSLMNFGFAYFTNIHTLSLILEKDLGAPEEVSKRAEFVCDILINYLTK